MKTDTLLIAAAGIAYVMLHLAGSSGDFSARWGVDGWRVLPPVLRWVLAGIGCLLMVPRVQELLVRAARSIGRVFGRMPVMIWTVPAGVLFWLGRQRTFFLGDGLLRIRNIEDHFTYAGPLPLVTITEPLDTILHSFLYTMLQPRLGVTGADIYQWISIIAGVCAVGIVARYARKLYIASPDRFTAVALVLTAGVVQLFFGYVESYTIAWMFVLWSLFSAMDMTGRGRFSLLPAFSLALAVLFHPLTIVTAPGIAAGYVMVLRSAEPASRRYRQGMLLAVLAAVTAGCFAMLAVIAHNQKTGTAEPFLSMLLPLIAGEGGYAILSGAHLADMFNELLLVAPALVLIPVMAVRWRQMAADRRVWVPAIACIGPLLIMLVFDPKLGFARDWDLFSLIAFPLTLVCVQTVRAFPVPKRYGIAAAVIVLSLIHTVPWVLLNASGEASFARFSSLARTPSWTRQARGMAHESLGTYYTSQERYADAASHYSAAYDFTGNTRFYQNVIGMYQRAGDPDALARFVHAHPASPQGYFYLGELYLRQGKGDEAAEALQKAVDMKPDLPGGYLQLGLAQATAGHYSEAVQSYSRALAMTQSVDDRALILTNRANAYLVLGNLADAVDGYRDAIELLPGYSLAHYNLAYACYLREDYETARQELDEARRAGHPPEEIERLERLLREVEQ